MAENCKEGFGNTGFAKVCDASFKAVRGIIVVPTFADDGTENHIEADTVLDDAFLTAQINEDDASKRWYPIQAVEAFDSTRAEPVTEELSSGAIEYIRQGARSVSFQIRRQDARYLGQIKACPCEELSFYLIDSDGKLMGMVKTIDGQDLYPIKMQPSSYNASFVFATETTNQYLTVAFQFALAEDDAFLRVYEDSLVEVSLLTAKGLLDVFATFTGVTTTAFTVKLSTLFTKGDKFNASGLVTADFVLKGNGTPITITSATETPAGSGTYVFVIPTTLTSVVKQLIPTKVGFDFTPVVAKTFTV